MESFECRADFSAPGAPELTPTGGESPTVGMYGGPASASCLRPPTSAAESRRTIWNQTDEVFQLSVEQPGVAHL